MNLIVVALEMNSC